VLAGSLALSARSPGFPELAHLPSLALRRFIKASPVERFRTHAKLLLGALDENSRFVGLRRDEVDFAPKDIDAVAAFLSCALVLHSYLARVVHRSLLAIKQCAHAVSLCFID
jgi:hypothetical protein